jgi:hypothetical protein
MSGTASIKGLCALASRLLERGDPAARIAETALAAWNATA